MCDSMWLTAISGTSRATASILAALTPTSKAPTSPGVLWTAMQPTWSRRMPAWRRASSMTGNSLGGADAGAIAHGGRPGSCLGLLRPSLPARTLLEERERVLVNNLVDNVLAMPAPLHLLNQLRHCQRVRLAPVARRVGHDPL